MKSSIKNLLSFNLKTLLGFETIYKLITTIIFVPLFLGMFHLTMDISNYNYLTFENIIPFLMQPLTIICLLFLLIFMTFYTFIDISTIIIILDSSYQKKKIKIKDAFVLALKKSLRVFKWQNILLPFLVIFLIPFLNIGVSSSFISTIAVPEFIMDFIVKNSLYFALYIILIIILTITLFRWLYVFHYFVLEDLNFKESCAKSSNLSKKNKLKDYLRIIITQMLLAFLYMLFIGLGVFLIIALYKLFGQTNILGNVMITIIWLFIAISFIIMLLLATPISYAIISILFFRHKEQRKEKVKHVNLVIKEEVKVKRKMNILKYAIIVLIIGSGTIFTYLVLNNKLNLNIEYVRTIEVTAHRGASVDYPENTMSAFVGAKEYGADWAELDVQQTLDQQLVVLHDTNLKRTTGVNKNTWEATYDEIKDLDAGSFFDKSFSDERIPLLKDVIEFAKKNNLKLNIELKPTGHEIDFEKGVIDLINEYNFKNNCVVTSQVYEVLENVKKYDDSIKTVYVMSLAYGNIIDLEYADSFSIEASSINKTLVNQIHGAGKEIYAWTVNTSENINKMININVDNIITDNITLAKNEIFTSKTSNVINEYVKLVQSIFD